MADIGALFCLFKQILFYAHLRTRINLDCQSAVCSLGYRVSPGQESFMERFGRSKNMAVFQYICFCGAFTLFIAAGFSSAAGTESKY